MGWDVLEGEDSLIGTHSSTQGPFLFYVGGSESIRSAKTGRTIGLSSEPVGAGGSTAVTEVSAEGGGPTAVPQESAGSGGSATAPEVLVGVGGSSTAPEVPREGDGSTTVLPSTREASPLAWEQGAGAKRPHPEEAEQGPRGSSPKCILCPTSPM